MPETVDIDAVDDAVLLKAFWLQRHIQKYGIEGIGFMEAGHEVAEDGDRVVAENIIARLNSI